MRNGDGQTAAYVGIRNSGKSVETLREVMIRIERPLVEGVRALTCVLRPTSSWKRKRISPSSNDRMNSLRSRIHSNPFDEIARGLFAQSVPN